MNRGTQNTIIFKNLSFSSINYVLVVPIFYKNQMNSHSGASTIKTLFQRPSGGSRDSVVFGSSPSGVKGGKSMKM
jgi:hypothetical protein